MNEELKEAISNIINNSNISFTEKYVEETTSAILKQVYMHKGKIDYRSKYVDMCEKDDARLTGFNLSALG